QKFAQPDAVDRARPRIGGERSVPTGQQVDIRLQLRVAHGAGEKQLYEGQSGQRRVVVLDALKLLQVKSPFGQQPLTDALGPEPRRPLEGNRVGVARRQDVVVGRVQE